MSKEKAPRLSKQQREYALQRVREALNDARDRRAAEWKKEYSAKIATTLRAVPPQNWNNMVVRYLIRGDDHVALLRALLPDEDNRREFLGLSKEEWSRWCRDGYESTEHGWRCIGPKESSALQAAADKIMLADAGFDLGAVIAEALAAATPAEEKPAPKARRKK